MQLSQKQHTFCEIFGAFWKSFLNSKNFEKKRGTHRFCIFEITDSENIGGQMSKKCPLRGPFDKQHGKGAQALLKYASQHLYHIH